MLPFMSGFMPAVGAQAGQFEVITPDTGSWVVPAGVTRISVAVMAGASSGARQGDPYTSNAPGGAGGTVAWASLNVTPGETFNYKVGAGGADVFFPQSDGNAGDNSFFTAASGTTRSIAITGSEAPTLGGLRPQSGTATITGAISGTSGSSRGGEGGLGVGSPGSGGGAGGWADADFGGAGADNQAGTGQAGSQGSAGGGGPCLNVANDGFGGGGVGRFGLGTSGAATTTRAGGKAGSGGTDGSRIGGSFGGGGAAGVDQGYAGGSGFLRIIWGDGRPEYPAAVPNV